MVVGILAGITAAGDVPRVEEGWQLCKGLRALHHADGCRLKDSPWTGLAARSSAPDVAECGLMKLPMDLIDRP